MLCRCILNKIKKMKVILALKRINSFVVAKKDRTTSRKLSLNLNMIIIVIIFVILSYYDDGN